MKQGTIPVPCRFIFLVFRFHFSPFSFSNRPLACTSFQFSVLTALRALEPALARHSKSKLFLCSRLLAAFTF